MKFKDITLADVSTEAKVETLGIVLDKELESLYGVVNSVEAMKGDKGDKGEQGIPGRDGKDGKPGVDGKSGVNGKDGKDGVDGKDGEDGLAAPKIIDAEVALDDTLLLTLSDGTEIKTTKTIVGQRGAGGSNGANGSKGDKGDAGVGIAVGGTTGQVLTKVSNTDYDTTWTSTQIAPNTSITGWNYSGLSKSVSAEESTPNGLFISPDGLNMYVNGSTGDDVNQYTLSTAFNVSTATYVRTFSTAAQDSQPNDIFFKSDGLSMYIIGSTNDAVFQYTLSSAWDISTATYASKSFSVTSQDSVPVGLWFKPDGTIMYVLGSTNDTVFQYTLGAAWDVSTASYASISFSVATQDTNPNQVNLSADGLTMWILGSTGDDITQYALGTAFNVSTAVFENSFYVGFQETAPTGLFIDSTANNRVYMVGSSSDTVFQYNTATNSISAVTDVFNTTSNARVQGNLAVQGSAVIDAALIAGNLTVGTTSISGTLTSSSTTTLATSSGTQTISLGAIATVSGSTKTLNMGTGGLSGSTTVITIGTATSGATSTTTLSGLVVNSISAAVSAAGTTQGTATGLVSNINNVTVVTAAAAGVRLPTAVAGMRILVRNSDSADVLSIYPATGGTINALSANAAFTIIAGATIELMATTATQWYTF